MSLWSLDELLDEIKLSCPACRAVEFQVSNESLTCKQCGASYANVDGVLAFAMQPGGLKEEIQTFWGDLYKQLYSDFEQRLNNMSAEEFEALLREFVPMLDHMEHLPVREIDLKQIAGKKILEIGCGAGAHSALFKSFGAKVVALDLTVGRVISAQRKLRLVRQGRGAAIQGDAENLPFADDTFDIVYSFGVLHHTEDTEKAIGEVYRVLKPGGQAAVMLYAKTSYFYYFNQLLVQGILRGEYARNGRWLGKVTEGKPQHSDTFNPITRVYTKNEMLHLFEQFNSLHLRKSAFNFSQVSIIGRYLPKLLVRMGICRESPAGVLVWDGPLRLETKLELALGHYIGFGWNITGRK